MEDLDLSNNSDDATLQVNGTDIEVSIIVSNAQTQQSWMSYFIR